MRFKVKNTGIYLSFTFFAVLLVLLCVGQLKICLYSLISSLIHETVHIIFILAFSGGISRITLTGFGANIKRTNDDLLKPYKEAIISFSAPVFNLIISLVVYLIYEKHTVFGTVNFVIGFFNLLPYYTFDGGRGLSFLLKPILSEKSIAVILDILSVCVTILFSFTSVYVFFHHNRNVTLLFLSIYMIANLFVLNSKVNKGYNY
ncbi:MAG: hypothetical protein E7530_05000 [Ruminococcaceae bacterium]|nr:hypothetical protein [Oscillospiraceae bacterium]